MQSREFPFSPNFNFGVATLFSIRSEDAYIPIPPVSGTFLLLNSTNFKLLDNSDFLLL